MTRPDLVLPRTFGWSITAGAFHLMLIRGTSHGERTTTYSSVGLTRLCRVCLWLSDLLWTRRFLGGWLCGCRLFDLLSLLSNGSGFLSSRLLCLGGRLLRQERLVGGDPRTKGMRDGGRKRGEQVIVSDTYLSGFLLRSLLLRQLHGARWTWTGHVSSRVGKS